ncbi:PAS domain-containing protein [bacterium]|nr:PAS domain-containing protein [bacterium]MBU1883154.1 PAS domain-containing protein [bacterium]
MSCEEEKKRIQTLEQEISRLNGDIEYLQYNQFEIDSMNEIFNKYTITSETDPRGFITYVSDPFVKISGYTKEELIGKPHNIVRHRDMPKEVFEDMWKTIQAKKIWKGEVKNRAKNGDFYWVESIIFPILNHKQEIEKYKSIRIDITDKKKLAEMFSGIMQEDPTPLNF